MQRLYSRPLTSLSMNLSIVGMNGSGKSAILVKYLTRRFIVEYAPYLSDSYTKNDTIDGQEVTLAIQDTSDSDDMDLDDLLKWSRAIIILFSITSRRSFYRAQELIESIKQNSTDLPPTPTLRGQVAQRPSSSIGAGTSMGIPNTMSSSSSSGLTSPISPLSPSHGSSSFRRSALYGGNLIRTPTLVLVANKSDLDRFRLVQKSEAEIFAKTNNIPYFETTAAETYQDVQSVFHAVVRLSNVGRFTKPRSGPNGGGVSIGRTLSSSTGTLGAATAGSVLSSLAVSPGLLLQKKPPNPMGSAILSAHEQSESACQNIVNTSGGTTSGVGGFGPTTSGSLGSGNASGVSADQPISMNPVTRLSNLRFRATSPPHFTKNLRSPSPGMPQRPVSADTPTGSQSSSNSFAQTASTVIGQIVENSRQSQSRATTPGDMERVNSMTKSPTRPIVSTISQTGGTKTTSAIPATGTSTPTPQGAASTTIRSPTTLVPPAPPPQPQKKVSKSFRFFSKKSK